MEFTHDLEPVHLEKLTSMATEVTFSEGEIIFREGDMHGMVYLIQEGQVAIEIQIPGRGRATILTVGPGQLVGWSSLFPPKVKTATARAQTVVRAIAIDAAQLLEACQESHDLGFAIFWRLAELIAERLKATRLQLLDIFATSTEP